MKVSQCPSVFRFVSIDFCVSSFMSLLMPLGIFVWVLIFLLPFLWETSFNSHLLDISFFSFHCSDWSLGLSLCCLFFPTLSGYLLSRLYSITVAVSQVFWISTLFPKLISNLQLLIIICLFFQFVSDGCWREIRFFAKLINGNRGWCRKLSLWNRKFEIFYYFLLLCILFSLCV